MFADKLKQFTSPQHQALEKKIVYRLKTVSTPADYLNILQLFYGYFGGLEDHINKYVDLSFLPDYNQRRKAGAIAHDIKTLGGNPSPKAVNGSLPQVSNNLQALGALYVIEGSTLGGSIISKMVNGKLGLNTGLTFFNGYGEDTHVMWGKFKEMLNNQVLTAEDQETVAEAANNTFIKFNNWVEQHG